MEHTPHHRDNRPVESFGHSVLFRSVDGSVLHFDTALSHSRFKGSKLSGVVAPYIPDGDAAFLSVNHVDHVAHFADHSGPRTQG